MMEWKNAIHGLRSKYIWTILMKNALTDGKRFLCLSRTSLAACRYGRALTITVLEPDYSQERTLSPCPVVVHAPFMHVQHYWVPTDAGFHVQNDQGCWSIVFPTSSTSMPNHPQTCWGVAKLCIHRAPHILCHGRAGCLDTRLAGSVNKSAEKQGDAPNHGIPHLRIFIITKNRYFWWFWESPISTPLSNPRWTCSQSVVDERRRFPQEAQEWNWSSSH